MRTRKSRRRGHSSPRAARVLPIAPPARRPCPRGNPLTDSVTIIDPAGTAWLAYVEPAPAELPFRRNAAVLPGRRLRFDSADASLMVSPIPAGAPFLADVRLLELLARAQPIPQPAAAPTRRVRARALWSVDWAGSVAALAGSVTDAARDQWRATAGIRRLGARALVQAVAPAVLVLVLIWDALLVRPRARI